MIAATLSVVLPELFLILSAFAGVVLVLYAPDNRFSNIWLWTIVAVFLLLAFLIGTTVEGVRSGFNGAFVDDPFARAIKVAILFSTAVILAMSENYLAVRGGIRPRLLIAMPICLAAMMIMVSTADLSIFLVSMIGFSGALYVLLAEAPEMPGELGFNRVLRGGIFSLVMLMTCSAVVLGLSAGGVTLFTNVTAADGAIARAALGALIASVVCTMVIAPAHIWALRLYAHVQIPLLLFSLSVVPLVGLAVLARLLQALAPLSDAAAPVLAGLALLLIILGAVAALRQTQVLPFLACTGFAHLGFALIGLATGSSQGVQAMLLYLGGYVIMTCGFAAFLLSMQKDAVLLTDIEVIKGSAGRRPGRALAFAFALCSLAGIPPFLGFVGKVALLQAVYAAGWMGLSVLSAMAALLLAFSYMRLLYYLYFGADKGASFEAPRTMIPAWVLSGATAVAVLGALRFLGFEAVALTAAQALVE
ncbi:MAG: proton-conducting transporter membrane subunit [Pseudomonadota bacterium]